MLLDDYISGEKMVGLADYIFGNEICDKNLKILNPKNLCDLKDGDIIYTRFKYYINLMKLDIRQNVKIIIHNSDRTFKNQVIKDNIIIYSQNVMMLSKNLHSIPIGLENKYNSPKIDKVSKMKEQNKKNKNMKNLLYINHNVSNNVQERKKPYDIFKNSNFVTLKKQVSFDEYLDDIYNHKFVLCPEGNVVVYKSDTNKNSYIKLNENGCGIELAEKKVISDKSLNGIHYWKKSRFFISSCKQMIKKGIRVNNEYYISLSYNEMINNNMRVKSYSLKDDEHFSLGVPEDLEKYIKYNENKKIR